VKRALLVDIGSEDWEADEQRIKRKGEIDVSNWVILSIRLGYKFVLVHYMCQLG
jgi:hypothetical protein